MELSTSASIALKCNLKSLIKPALQQLFKVRYLNKVKGAVSRLKGVKNLA